MLQNFQLIFKSKSYCLFTRFLLLAAVKTKLEITRFQTNLWFVYIQGIE